MDTQDSTYLGRGVYSLSEAAKLSGVPYASISRWTRGYDRVIGEVRRKVPPVFNRDYVEIEGKTALSFLDLVEVMFVEAFVHHGVNLRTVRKAVAAAARSFGFSHPFAKKTFLTDGRTILALLAHETGDDELLDLVGGQFEIADIVRPILKGDLEFGEFDIADRWWPMGKDGSIVVDPARNLGQPTIAPYNIPTFTLFKFFESAGSETAVADWYEIDKASVEAAVYFESRLLVA